MSTRVMVDQSMLVSAVRYALGRKTYIVENTTAEIRSAWPHLTPQTRAIIERDIRRDVDDATTYGTYVGMRMDHDAWTGLLNWIQDQEAD